MDAQRLRELILTGETYRVEFKKGSINDSELVEAVVCLANGSGGHLLVGVEDDKRVTGADHRHGNRTDPVRLEAMVANRTEDPVLTDIEVIVFDGHEVIAVEVPSSSSVVGSSDGRFVRRAIDVHGKPTCLPMRPHEITARVGAAGALDYGAVHLPGATHDLLDPYEFERFRNMVSNGGDESLAELSDEDILKALDLSGLAGELTVGAVLLFGTESALRRHVPAYEVSLHELDQLEVRNHSTMRIPLLRAMEALVAGVELRNTEEEIEIGMFRVPIPRYSHVAIRELIANALVHREYRLPGPTVVEIDQLAMTISNPGGFPEGVTLDNLLTTPPRPRNPTIADAFKRAGLVEKTSRGINRVFHHQLRLGHAAPDYGRSTQTSVVVRVESGPADLELAAFVNETQRQGTSFDLNDLLVLHEVRSERRITTARAAELFQLDHDAARSTLNSLVERGVLESRGEGRSRTYHLAASVYRRLGGRADYVRTRGFDRLQQEQMVLTYVSSHGQITRREAAALCQLSSEQARNMLQRLRSTGKLEMKGRRRTANYVLPGGDA